MTASRPVFRALVGIAFAITMVLHLRWCWSTFEFLRDVTSIPNVRVIEVVSDQLRITRVPDNLAAQGVRKGDRLVAVNGEAAQSRGGVFRVLRRLKANTEARVEFEHADGGRVAAAVALGQFEKEPYPLWTWIYGFAVNVFTPGICIALAFFIVWQRPDSGLAWLLLPMLYGLSQGARFNGIFRLEYSPWFGIPGAFLLPFGTILWPAAWLWFCLDFPDRKSAPWWLSWTRWVVGPVGVFFAVFIGIESVLNQEFGRSLETDAVFEALSKVSAPYGAGAALGGLVSLVYKILTERDRDSLRRLRVLGVGLALGMVPLIVALLYGFNRLPEYLQIAAVLMMIFVPVTVGYVLIVDRALDVGVVVRQGLQYALARRGAAVIQGLMIAGLILTVFTVGADQMTSRPLRLAMIALAFASIFFVQRLTEWVQRWIDRRFFREAVNAEHLLAELSEQVRTMVEPEELIATVKQRIAEALHVSRVEFSANGTAAEWAELRLPVRTQKAELGELRLGGKRSEEPYAPSEVRLLESVATQTAFALENSRLTAAVAEEAAQRERIHREIEIAREVQERLLPKRAPEVAGLDIAGVCIPAQAIGGDYYDYVRTPSGEMGFAIGDIAGKGIPASLLMASLQASLRGLIAGGMVDLPELMTRLNRLIHEATPANRFATFFYALYEPERRRLRCVCAGHNPALLVRANGTVEWIKPKGVALGLARVAKYEERDLVLAPGDVLVLYTDGVTEAMNGAREEFGEGRLEGVGTALLGKAAERARDEVLDAVRGFVDGAPPHDDLTLLILRAV